MEQFDERVRATMKEAKRFLAKGTEYLDKADAEVGECYAEGYCKESAAVRRASMDLTRALADMRKPQ